MTVTNIIQRVNDRMNYESYSYNELKVALDAAIDYLNINWRINLPVITDLTEMTQKVDDNGIPVVPATQVPSEYNNLPDDFIRMYIVPFAAAHQYTINEQDATPEAQEALTSLGKLSERYGQVAGAGITKIEVTDANFDLLTEDTTDQFSDGHDNFNLPGQDSYSGPLGDY